MKGILSGINMGFIGVILSIKRKGFRFIGLWYILYRVQNNTVVVQYSSTEIICDNSVIEPCYNTI